MSTMSDMARVMRSGSLEAQLHQGYDPSFEYKEQGTLFSNVHFGQNHHTPVPILQEILNSVSNLFFDDGDLISNNQISDQNNAQKMIPVSASFANTIK